MFCNVILSNFGAYIISFSLSLYQFYQKSHSFIEIYLQFRIFSEFWYKNHAYNYNTRRGLLSKRERATCYAMIKRFSLSPYNISIIQTKPFISANYIVTRSEGQKKQNDKVHRWDRLHLNSVPRGTDVINGTSRQ